MKATKVLSVKNYSLKIDHKNVLSNISFELGKGEILGIVGESGSGKSLTALSILKLLNIRNSKSSGEIFFNGNSISQLEESEIKKIRGNEISIVFQEPMSSLNPSMKCGHQISEIILNHEKISTASSKIKSLELIRKVKLSNPNKIYEKYPHELSGGQQQRIMIAIAIACKPKLLITDEPTTSLDSIVKNEILSLIKSLQSEFKMSVIFISHDLNLISKFVDNILILRNGKIVEKGRVKNIFKSPKNEYTLKLLSSNPPKKNRPYRLLNSNSIKTKLISTKQRKENHKIIYDQNPILEIKNISVSYANLTILNNISFDLFKGEVLGIVGESGSGKSTIAKCILGLIQLINGKILFSSENIFHIKNSIFRKKIQLIFQDPYSSLNPEMSIGDSIVEPMIVHKIFSTKEEMKLKALALLSQVGLSESDYYKFPDQFSGGQRQRIVIARALVLNPEIIVCDESVSALDVSIQAEILNLLNDLKEKHNLTYIFISHDMSVIKYFTDRVIVLNKGNIIELNETDALFKSPKNDYTKALLKASNF
ncbi:MAG: ABC transporter ATP-binding protein [Flavobacteriaceae bacterium]|nr:ABC transporter ATP-binding protein [Flavobacteriaceae bacterium]